MDAYAILDASNDRRPAADMSLLAPTPLSSCIHLSMPPRRGHERRDHRRRPLVHRPAYVLRTPSLFALTLISRSCARAPPPRGGSSMLAADMAPGGGYPGSRRTAPVALLEHGHLPSCQTMRAAACSSYPRGSSVRLASRTRMRRTRSARGADGEGAVGR
jgi:hypothetical protein